jgi:hypothetical protein
MPICPPIIATMRRLFDHPRDHVTVREAYGVERPRPIGRPWLGVCMVASIDGSTVVDSNSRSLSSKTDQEVLLTLRDRDYVIGLPLIISCMRLSAIWFMRAAPPPWPATSPIPALLTRMSSVP